MLRRRLLERIETGGPLPFEEFMRAALYDPEEGFFASGPLRSAAAGDFLTSPEVSPLFGRMLARFVAAERERLGSPGDFVLVEAGAGSGSLLGPLLADLAWRCEAWAVEVSPAARRALAGVVGEARVVGSLGEVPAARPGVVMANELLDDLPAALAVRTPGGWEERWVGREGDRLVLVAVPARPEVAAWADRFGLPAEPGDRVEVQLEACRWLEEALGVLEAGSVVVIDYGDTAEGLAPRRREGTLRTYRAHHLGPDHLAEPGMVDLTMDVNFTALEDTARRAGAAVELFRQEDFLATLGLPEVLAGLRERELALAREGKQMERLRVRSELTGGRTLLHPRGLGDFRVLIARREPGREG